MKSVMEAIMAQRRQFGSKFKAKVALDAIKGEKTLNELSSIYGVHQNQISKWKKKVLELLPEILADRRSKNNEDQAQREAKLYQQIGQLTMEVEYLKKKLGLFQ